MTDTQQDQPKTYSAKELQKLKEIVEFFAKQGTTKWTPETIKQASPELLFAAMGVLDTDIPEHSKILLPKGMTLQTFDRMMNREVSRRQMWPQYYQQLVEMEGGVRVRGKYEAIPELGAVLELGRPKITMDSTGMKLAPDDAVIKTDPMTVAMYDALIDTMITNKSGLVMRDDTADALGYKRRTDGNAWGTKMHSDVADHRLMYAVGSLKYFNPTPGVGEGTEAAFLLTPGLTNGQLQKAFCGLTPTIYEKGRSTGLPGARDAGLPGLLEARVDARTGGFETNDVPPDGLFQPCSVPMASNNNEPFDKRLAAVASR